jgi:hypothetical protein
MVAVCDAGKSIRGGVLANRRGRHRSCPVGESQHAGDLHGGRVEAVRSQSLPDRINFALIRWEFDDDLRRLVMKSRIDGEIQASEYIQQVFQQPGLDCDSK